MSKDKTDLAKRIKEYESITDQKLIKQLPFCLRLDGVCFHNFCKNLAKPFDTRLTTVMLELTKWLVEEFEAKVGYTQSDEINLCWNSTGGETLYNSRILKLCSIFSAKASVKFNQLLIDKLPEKVNKCAVFDARVFNVPNLEEATNLFVWRELDATRNSIQMAGHAHFSPNKMHGKKSKDVHEMLFKEKGINWNNYPPHFKRGSFFIRKKVKSKIQACENLPAKHQALQNPNLEVERTVIELYDKTPIVKIANRTGFLFYDEPPMES